ncbi:unnamed protein product [Acidocella sp. C78]|uniref:ATP-binding cassette domain-containing protein n=1 Tax=Acidocella sp. C78 TaxID=1671486 RepID=UPI001BC2B04B|nr:unnamed protein product [Acidocella sp. C78]
MSAVLEADGLQTYYGKSHILHGVSLKVNQGELIALLGRNGAGKTTTMRSVMGLTPPRGGNIKLFGKDVTKAASHRIANAGVGYVPEGRKIFGHMTVHENLLVPPKPRGPGPSRRSTSCFRGLRNARPARAAGSRAASRKCSPSPARCCSTRNS